MRGAILYDKDRVNLRVDFKIGLLISSNTMCPNKVRNPLKLSSSKIDLPQVTAVFNHRLKRGVCTWYSAAGTGLPLLGMLTSFDFAGGRCLYRSPVIPSNSGHRQGLSTSRHPRPYRFSMVASSHR
jgi:hypothetical protein